MAATMSVIETDHTEGPTIPEMQTALKSKGVKSTYKARDEYLAALKVCVRMRHSRFCKIVSLIPALSGGQGQVRRFRACQTG